jgi:uncharacterized damage-inducible protein DinB
MKKSLLFFTIVTLFLSATSCKKEITPEEKAFDFKKSFVKILENAKEYTLEVAEAMPQEDYTYKVSDSVRTFGEQVAHIGLSSQFILGKFIKGETPSQDKKSEQEIGASKEETLLLLNIVFDDAIETLKNIEENSLGEKIVIDFIPGKPEFTKQEGFYFLRDHISHHRGQAIVYLRAKGQKAPQYRAF